MIRTTRDFVEGELYPLERAAAGKAFADVLPELDNLRQKVKSMGLWTPHLPAEYGGAGLSLSDDGPTYNGQLIEQVSTSERLRISVAMGLALNPKLKVLLVHEGNDLDDDGLKLLAEIAAEHEAQVWLERIAGAAEGVSIVIEDGAVKA